MSKKEKIVNVTPDIITAWKQQYGEVYCLEVAEEPESNEANTVSPDMDEIPKITGYLRKPDRKAINYAIAIMPKSVVSAGKAVVKDSWLGGDDRLLWDERYASTAGLQAIELVEIYQSRLKKV